MLSGTETVLQREVGATGDNGLSAACQWALVRSGYTERVLIRLQITLIQSAKERMKCHDCATSMSLVVS